MDMSKGYKTLLLVFALVLLTGCGVRFAPMTPTEPSATPTWDVPPPPTATPLLSPPPDAVPRGTPVVTPTPGVSTGKAPVAEGKHYPPRLPENWAPEEPTMETAAMPTTYTVQGGDCLWTIAEALYGSWAGWRRLWECNRDTVEDPSLVLVGQVLTLPEA